MNTREQKLLRETKTRVEESLKQAPEGSLRCEMAQGKYPQYYIKTENSQYPYGKYIKKKDIELARRLAQKEYDQKILELVYTYERKIRNEEKNYFLEDIKDIYDNLNDARKKLVTPYIKPDEEFVSEWETQINPRPNGIPIQNVFYTEKGEQVRSKSEKMIADKLKYEEIPYIYEPLLVFSNKDIVYPDFKLLNKRTREIYYLEHFGMMDDAEYCRKALEKIDTYEKNGIFLGEQLLVSFESSTKAINMKQIDSYIKRKLK